MRTSESMGTYSRGINSGINTAVIVRITSFALFHVNWGFAIVCERPYIPINVNPKDSEKDKNVIPD